VTDAFTCPRCRMTSHHPTDLEQGYCGNCHDWTRADRWAAFDVAELQQLYAALHFADRADLFPAGPGNLLPRLARELADALDNAIARDEAAT
jgi:hypothetical protein